MRKSAQQRDIEGWQKSLKPWADAVKDRDETIAALQSENARLAANQLPGRCEGCRHNHDGTYGPRCGIWQQYFADTCHQDGIEGGWSEATGFCAAWTAKEGNREQG